MLMTRSPSSRASFSATRGPAETMRASRMRASMSGLAR